ncbi:serine/arginine-rich splicing factor SC35-like [Eucalyptus grandis]|uniref:serine/arginine-rich splicing factor SC35-like n=1 Tax=Eucalyptus grandis TaxID=71139 RepID=UPI00192EF4B3|nr:serine/arginine-rich splicing factor SC35-like [Eucalyptus grandis]
MDRGIDHRLSLHLQPSPLGMSACSALPPHVSELLVLNISFRSSLLSPAPTPFASVALCVNASRGCFAGTTADDLFPLFDKYGKVVDVFIPRDRRTGESRGFAFVRYKYADEAQKAVDKLHGREIGVQFAKYGPNAERIEKGKITEPVSKMRRWSRSRSPLPRYRDEYGDRDYRRRSRSRSRGRYDRNKYRDGGRSYRHQSRSYSTSPDRRRDRRAPKYDDEDRSRSGSYTSSSQSPQKAKYERSRSPNQRPSTLESPDVRNGERDSQLQRDVPSGRPANSGGASPRSP